MTPPLYVPFHRDAQRSASDPLSRYSGGGLGWGRLSACALALLALLSALPLRANDDLFESKIRPLLVEKCYACHSAEAKKLKADLYVDSRDALLKGGESGPALVPGHPESSRLIEAVGYKNPDLQMPPKDKLSGAQIADLTEWVKQGAPWGNATGATPVGPVKSGWDFDQKKGDHWAWKPLRATSPPQVPAATPVDAFLLAALQAKGLTPAPQADRRALIRRAAFDLTGLPPTPEEVEAFVTDTSPDAWPTVIDRLLASPHFGERWARHWMDLVRYAEGYGHEFDYPVEHAYQYRDYLIRAFNADVPYDAFVTEHLAGDLLPKPRLHPTEGTNESIVATGFWFLGEQLHAPVDSRQDQADRLDNQVDVMGKTFLAMTLGCARCHDHKFDPIPTRDVYGLWGYLEGTRRQIALLDPHGRIHATAQQLATLRNRGSDLLAHAAFTEGIDVAAYLSAAAEVTRGEISCEDLARRASLDPTRLAKWIDALADDALKQPAHPLFTFRKLATTTDANFAKARAGVATDLAKRHQAATDALAPTTVFKDFVATAFDGWYVTGEAFGSSPTHLGQWDCASPRAHVIDQPAADSRQLATRFAGVLRSPDFIIQHDTILTHCAGESSRLRLIVDNYEMGVHSGLLFGDHQPAVSSPDFHWVRQFKDVARYLGHRAHFEILDDGPGWVAVDQIRFADTGAEQHPLPPPDVSPLALAAATEGTTPRALATASAAAITQSLSPTTADGAKLLNWLLAHGLVDSPATADLTSLARQMTDASTAAPEPVHVLAAADGDPVDEHVFIRGSPKNLGEVAPRHAPRIITGDNPSPAPAVGCGRLSLAQQLVDPKNPLISRVIVNRLWHHLFGRGIVASTDNFGALGTLPSHPELLDYLAARFVTDDHWSIKQALRELMLTSAYQMSSAATDAKAEELDPQNLLLHRANVRRLEGEAIRDEMLAVSGRLDPALFGPSVPVYLTPFMDGRGKPASGPIDGAGRRSLYLAVRRNFLSPMMLAFDTPQPFSTMGRRSLSNVPAQALILMNDPFVQDQAALWAKRTIAATPDFKARVTLMYTQAFARPPTPQDLSAAQDFIAQEPNEPKTWTDYAHVLLNLKEFIFLK